MGDTTVDTSATTGSLPDQIAAQIRANVESLCRRHDATTQDVLRIYRDQICNLFMTEQVQSAMRMDPFQHLKEHIPSKELERIIHSISVVSHHSVTTLEGYVRTEAIVSLSHLDTNNSNNIINRTSIAVAPDTTGTQSAMSGTNNGNNTNKKRPRANPQHSEATGAIQLHFTYTRSSMTSISPCTVSYTIDVCRTAAATSTSSGASPHQPLLWIHVSAAGAVPSSHNSRQAIDINKIDDNDNDDDQWSDIDDDEQNGEVVDHSSAKEKPTSRSAAETESANYVASTGDDDASVAKDNLELNRNMLEPIDHHGVVDRYEAGMDPDVVSLLTTHLGFLNNNDATNNNNNATNDNDRLDHNYDDVTIFFWLMTFPFYEHEWDLVGFLLQAVFDSNDNDSIDGDGSDYE